MSQPATVQDGEAFSVSIILPAYNAQDHISAAIESVRKQTCRSWDLIVVDDGSTDDTAAIAESFAKTDPRVKLISQKNGKLAKARNAGMSAATGKFFAFLDADDVWTAQKLEKQLAVHNETHADVVFTDAYHFAEQQMELPVDLFGRYTGFHSGKSMFEQLYLRNAIPVSSALISARGVAAGCRFDESEDLYGLEDFEFWLRLASKGASFFGMAEKLIGYRSRPDQMSRNEVNMMLSSIAARQRHREFAREIGIDTKEVDRCAFRDLLYASFAAKNRTVFRFALKKLSNPAVAGVKGLRSAAVFGLKALRIAR